MSYFSLILSIIILNISIFAMEKKDRKDSDYSSYSPKKEIYERQIPPNKSVKDVTSNSKYSSDQKNKNSR